MPKSEPICRGEPQDDRDPAGHAREVLDAQFELTRAMKSPYVFIKTEGRPILQDKLREVWARVMKKSGLMYRRMHETRHDGSAFERQFLENTHKKRDSITHNYGHNGQNHVP